MPPGAPASEAGPPERRPESEAVLLRLRAWLLEAAGGTGTALDDRVLEQPFGRRVRVVHARRVATGALAKQRDLLVVAAEVTDVALHPLERGDLIAQAIVARGSLLDIERGVHEEAEATEPVVDRDDDDPVRARELGA